MRALSEVVRKLLEIAFEGTEAFGGALGYHGLSARRRRSGSVSSKSARCPNHGTHSTLRPLSDLQSIAREKMILPKIPTRAAIETETDATK